METIKIVRIGGEYLNNKNQVSEYINPYTGNDFNTWYEFEEGKKIFDSLNYESLLKEDEDILPEYKQSREDLEFNVISNLEDGFKPFVYLFSFLIPLDVWENREIYAEISNYDCVWNYLTDFTNYDWKLEIQKEISISKKLLKKYELKTNKIY